MLPALICLKKGTSEILSNMSTSLSVRTPMSRIHELPSLLSYALLSYKSTNSGQKIMIVDKINTNPELEIEITFPNLITNANFSGYYFSYGWLFLFILRLNYLDIVYKFLSEFCFNQTVSWSFGLIRLIQQFMIMYILNTWLVFCYVGSNSLLIHRPVGLSAGWITMAGNGWMKSTKWRRLSLASLVINSQVRFYYPIPNNPFLQFGYCKDQDRLWSVWLFL